MCKPLEYINASGDVALKDALGSSPINLRDR
jgi:hypothetical protein